MIAVVASLFTVLFAAAPAPAAAPQLVYDIIVTQPGTRSQGWRGRLYDEEGTALAIPAGWRVATPLGTFESVACPHMWSACGMIREDMLAWMASGPAVNTLDGTAWVFRVNRIAGPDGAAAWQGELTRDGVAAAPSEAPVATPMGDFRIGDPAVAGLTWSGWAPASWTAAVPTP